MPQDTAVARISLDWYEIDGLVVYRLFAFDRDGQQRYLDSFDQGPFDTALEVAQWAWRRIARELPPASC